MANLKSIFHICHQILVAFVWKLTKETINLPWVASRVVSHLGLGLKSVERLLVLPLLRLLRLFRGTSLIRNTHPPRITIGP